tara:strand:+ start:3678 stop:3911 length:234 start_codon:yes stop_codon:yes gene_type:complete
MSKLRTFKTDSQCARILRHLESGKSLTVSEARCLGFGDNLRSRISNIKESGIKIKSETVNFNGGFIAKYSIDKELLG